VSEGTLFVVSSPSGAGKRTILKRVLAEDDCLALTTSATTRRPRPGEVNGHDYYFISRETFRRRVEAGEFVEWAEVHGNLYGTLRAELDRVLGSGMDAILEIDVQGMQAIRNQGLRFVSIFIMPPSLEELEARLRKRGTDSPEAIALRLRNARAEIKARHQYDHTIVNDVLDEAVARFQAIVRTERRRSSHKTDV